MSLLLLFSFLSLFFFLLLYSSGRCFCCFLLAYLSFNFSLSFCFQLFFVRRAIDIVLKSDDVLKYLISFWQQATPHVSCPPLSTAPPPPRLRHPLDRSTELVVYHQHERCCRENFPKLQQNTKKNFIFLFNFFLILIFIFLNKFYKFQKYKII